MVEISEENVMVVFSLPDQSILNPIMHISWSSSELGRQVDQLTHVTHVTSII